MAGPTYVYYSTVPQGATQFNLTQPQILSNFQAIYELFAINHVNFNIPDNYGKHNFVTMEFQTDDPDGQEEEIIMYTKSTVSPNLAEIYIRYPNNTTNDIYQLSVPATPATATGSSGGTASQGWCSFPSGILFRWGTYSIVGSKSYNLSSYTSGPSYKQFWNPSSLSPTSSGCKISMGVTMGAYTNVTTGFTSTFYSYTSTSVTTNINYLNIGI